MRTIHLLLAVATLAGIASPQNSTKKIRSQPSELAARAGSAVEWREDLEAALAEAKSARKPVFWYVPTIAGSFMDRKPEVDRYMLAGPFSWPRTAALLNEHFVPVRMAADEALCKAYDLEPIAFIEPGWLVLDRKGEERAREHQITTFHPARFLAPLAALVDQDQPAPNGLPGDLSDPATAAWMEGVEHWRNQREEKARAAWQALADGHPDHPMAAKAAMELEGHGPFVHAFETYAQLPAAALVPHAGGTLAPVGAYTETELRARSVQFLLETQRESGGWEDSTYDFGGTDSLPNVYVAVTAICSLGLLEHAAQLKQPDEALETALARAFDYMQDEDNLNLDDADEIFWAHSYRVRCMVRWLELRPDDGERVRPLLEGLVAKLMDSQGSNGAWRHEYQNPFVTADALIALSEARRVMAAPERVEQIAEQGVASLLTCRTDEGAYTYGQARRRARASIEGSVGRTPRGELAIWRWSPEDSIGLQKAVALSFEHEEHLLPVRKYDDHTRNFAYGGFFFFYDLNARTEAIVALPEGRPRSEAARRQREQFLGLPEFDGAFMDSHEIGRSYGTGMALWCLAQLDSISD